MPENHSKPDGANTDLHFAVMSARALSPVADPAIYVHGGPGSGTMKPLASLVCRLFDGHSSRRAVVFDRVGPA